MVSAGADKGESTFLSRVILRHRPADMSYSSLRRHSFFSCLAIVAWEWRTGKKLVRFGQQINMCIGVQIMDEDRIVSVTIGEMDCLLVEVSVRAHITIR